MSGHASELLDELLEELLEELLDDLSVSLTSCAPPDMQSQSSIRHTHTHTNSFRFHVKTAAAHHLIPHLFWHLIRPNTQSPPFASRRSAPMEKPRRHSPAEVVWDSLVRQLVTFFFLETIPPPPPSPSAPLTQGVAALEAV